MSSTLIDDRLLVALLVGERVRVARSDLFTTSSWYYRACRAAVAGGAGQLSGPFARLGAREQAMAIQSTLQLPDDVELPDPRLVVPEMVRVHQRHERLNLMNLEAVAGARVLDARVLLSERAAEGILPEVLDAEKVSWRVAKIGVPGPRR